MNIKLELAKLINLDGVTAEDIAAQIEPTAIGRAGDYSLPCFRLAKTLRKNPAEVAAALAAVANLSASAFASSVTAAGGYLNFFLSPSVFCAAVAAEINRSGANIGASDLGAGKTVCIDYSSVNIAKPLHMGHLGTTAIGNSLYKIHKKLGYNVVGINHLGDYGTQFGKLITAYKKWGKTVDKSKSELFALNDLYVRFHAEAEANPALEAEARAEFLNIECGEPEAVRLFEHFKEITLAEVCRTYDELGVTFDSFAGESFFSDKMAPVLADLRAKKLTVISDGAEVVDLSAYDMPPCILVRSDGASLYATRDIAAAHYRKQTYNFDKCLYVVAYQQNLHFKQVFKVLEIAEYPWAADLVHVAYGMVSLEEGKMSTREGRTVWLIDVLEQATQKAREIIAEKSPDLPDKETVAHQVGTGAVIFSALAASRIKDVTFTFDRVLNFDGETAPYLQYTHARACSILDKAAAANAGAADAKTDAEALSGEDALALAKKLNGFEVAVLDAAQRYEPSAISTLLIDTAQAFNGFYSRVRVLEGTAEQIAAKLALVRATKHVLASGLALLGICAPERM